MADRSKQKPHARLSLVSQNAAEVGNTLQPSFPTGFISAATNYRDAAEGRRIAEELVALEHDATHAHQIEASTLKVKYLDADLNQLDKDMRAVASELANTPKFISAADANDNRQSDKPTEISFRDWQMRHKVEAIAFGAALVVALLTSFLTTQANLAASGVPAFIEQPLLAYLIAAIAPTASLAIKSIGSIFHKAPHRSLFQFFIYLGTAVSFAIWLILLSHQYHGLSAEIDLFGETGEIGSEFFVMFQLLTEVLVGTSLFLRLKRIAENYAPNFWVYNLEYEVLTRRQIDMRKDRADIIKQLAAERAMLVELPITRLHRQKTVSLAIEQRLRRFDD